jgi:16S rRNA (cytosine967-C5)-methyltransferase
LISPLQFETLLEATKQVLRFVHPADAVLKHFFRDNKNLGMRDRGLIAETIYALLRKRTWVMHLTQSDQPRLLLLATLVKVQGWDVKAMSGFTKAHEREMLRGIAAAVPGHLSLPAETNFPEWLIQLYLKRHTRQELIELARGLDQPGPLDLRVNTMHSDRDTVLAELAEIEVEASATPFSPVGIRVVGKPALQQHKLLVEGHVEVQDEGSQLLGYLLAPKRGEMVVDFCAGAGGKTLLLGALMHSTGRLYAFDVSEKRLTNLKPRLKRSGLSNVQPVRIEHENDARIKRLAGKVDRVLVDSPCSGLGTLRRNPDLKWRQNAEDITELATKQRNILASAAQLLKPGGRLVYATCSILFDENQAIVENFLASNNEFNLLNSQEILHAQQIEIDCGESFQVFPHRHNTDGFFAAVLEKHV